MVESPHAELITALTDLYTLLDTLATIPPDSIHLPPHAPGEFNVDTARAAGYAPEALNLLEALPYLDFKLERELEILPNTDPSTYLGRTADEGFFESHRAMLRNKKMPSRSSLLSRLWKRPSDCVSEMQAGTKR